jgi:hypothetical protein
MQIGTIFAPKWPLQRWITNKRVPTVVGKSTVVFGERRSLNRANWANPNSPRDLESDAHGSIKGEHTLEVCFCFSEACHTGLLTKQPSSGWSAVQIVLHDPQCNIMACAGLLSKK